MLRRNLKRTILLAVGLMIGSSAGVLADGVILPDLPEQGWLSIVHHDVEITIRDGVVTTQVDQLFRNDTHRDIEGRYVFPLPPGAVVSAFTMWVDGDALEARLLEADDARAIYEDYVRRMIDPALLEYVGRDTLSARIYPIPAGGERRIEITYTELLTAESGTYRYRYPLDTERFSARPLERATLAVDVQTTGPLQAIYSPTHPLDVVRAGTRAATARYEAHGVLPTEDFLLYLSVSSDRMGMTMLTYRLPDEDGYFLLIGTPPESDTTAVALPKDLVFVLDSSGSMHGEKIEQAKQALRYVVSNLHPDDRFAVIAFSDAVRALHPHLVEVTPASVQAATTWASAIEAEGGTNIDDALSAAMALFESNDRPRFLIFLTDGEPTVGVTEPAAIAAHALAANDADARVFAFGVGYDVNTVLLDQLARENRGTATYVLPGENLEVVLSGFYRKIASPVLAEPRLAIEGLETYDVHPTGLPDLFRGTQLLVVGRYSGSGELPVTIAGHAAGAAISFTTVQAFPEVALEHVFLPRLWAGRKVSVLLQQIRLYGESDELVDAVIALSRRYGIITPYTSFLVDDDVETEAEAAEAVRNAAAAPVVGANAVAGAAALKTLSEGATVQSGVEGVRTVGDRTYYSRDGVWVDSAYEDEETIDIVVFSDAYFRLAELVPWIAPHLAVGDRAIVAVGDRFVRIADEGMVTLTNDVIERLTG